MARHVARLLVVRVLVGARCSGTTLRGGAGHRAREGWGNRIRRILQTRTGRQRQHLPVLEGGRGGSHPQGNDIRGESDVRGSLVLVDGSRVPPPVRFSEQACARLTATGPRRIGLVILTPLPGRWWRGCRRRSASGAAAWGSRLRTVPMGSLMTFAGNGGLHDLRKLLRGPSRAGVIVRPP